MNRDALIDTLASDLRPMRKGMMGRRITFGVVIGGLVTLVFISLTTGFNPHLADAMARYHFWVKWTYCLSLAILAIAAVRAVARPEGRMPGMMRWLGLPVLMLAAIGVAEMLRVPPSHWLAMWLGRSWMVCPWLVLIDSMPIFVGLLWSFRRFAPTRLREAGAAAGLAAGAIGATLYCLDCPEVSAIFVLTWYSLGIVLATAVGALLGPRLMRW